MALKPSYYNHFTTADDGRVIVFNKFWGSVQLLNARDGGLLQAGNVAGLPADLATELENAGFLVPDEMDEREAAHGKYLHRKANNSVLALTIELTQECNLGCPYCYQNSYKKPGNITQDTVSGLLEYMDRVLSEHKRPITDVVMRFIGGEPLMQKEQIFAAIEGGRKIAGRHRVGWSCQADTNGLLLDERVVRELDAVSVTLTNKADHDRLRVRKNGAGTYEQILKRLRKHADDFNAFGTVLSIRFNANALNAAYVPDIYRMTRDLGINETEFELYNTIQYTYNAPSVGLSKDGFKRLYMDLIRLKVESGETVTDFPRPTFAPCSAYTPYNLKVAADGSLALCDAMHTTISSLDQLRSTIDRHGEIFADVADHDPFKDEQCGACTNVGICGGKLYCKSNENAPELDPCDFLPFDMDEFLRFFAETYPERPEAFAI